MTTVVVTGVAGEVASHLLPLLEDDDGVTSVVGIDLAPPRFTGDKVSFHQADIVTDDLKPLFEGADAVIHLAAAYGPQTDEAEAASANVDGSRQVLDAAGSAGVDHLVVLSSATVYGAWDNNPVPLTEDAPVRPNPELTYAVHKAEVERLVAEFTSRHPSVTVATLRPTVALSEKGATWISRSLRAARLRKPDADDPPAQFLHLDDLASAIDLARRSHLSGAYNVAPDGWLDAETVRALAGEMPRPRLPEGLGTWLATLRWRLGIGQVPPGFIPYANQPWVVANDRLRAAGWAPAHTNEEVFVAAHDANWYTELSPSRRQELALAVAGGAALLVGGVVAVILRRRRT